MKHTPSLQLLLKKPQWTVLSLMLATCSISIYAYENTDKQLAQSNLIQTNLVQTSGQPAQHAIPASVARVMQAKNLNQNELSFIVTPLQSSVNDTAQVAQVTNRLPIKAVELKIREKERAKLIGKGLSATEIELHFVDIDNVNLEQKNAKFYTESNQQSKKPLNKTYRHLAEKPRTPASTMKLIPTFVALDTLGKDFVWATKAYYTGYTVGNTLHGNLILKGGGDPKLTHQKLANLLYKVKKLGIQHIDGDIVIDSGVFRNVSKDPAEFDNAPLQPYNASPDGMLVNFSTMTINAYPLNNGSQLFYEPQLSDIEMPEKLGHRRARCQSTSRSLNPVWQLGKNTGDKLQFNSRIPNDCGRHSFYIAYPDAKEFAQRVIKAKWLAMGNTLSGNVRNQMDKISPLKHHQPYQFSQKKNPDFTNTLAIATELSYPLSEQIYDINHHSNNVMTEQVLLSIPVYQKQKATVETIGKANKISDYPTAIYAINDWWKKNLVSQPPYMTNGSGLCRTCSVTATNLNELLGKAYQHPDFAVYVNSLGVAGVSGTIATHKYRSPQSAAIGRAWIKTGTLNNVTAMAGYVKGESGQEYSVVAFINLPKGTRGANQKRPVLDALIDWVAQH